MKPSLILGFCSSLILLASCSSGAPSAPMGLDKRPANSTEAIASLVATGDRTPIAPQLARPENVASEESAAPTGREAGLPGQPIVVLSDFSAPAGIQSLAEAEQRRLISDARNARAVILLCRGDRQRPSWTSWTENLQRGVRLKQFLVRQGVNPRHIRLFVRSAGAFIADNTTAEGRAKNRRVEIRLS